MTTEITQRMQNQLDAVVQVLPDEEVEFWFARDLQEPLGYARWENFMTAIRRAIESCETMGYTPDDHFRGVTKMVRLGSGAERAIDDFMLTRYACYLIAMNGDPRKASRVGSRSNPPRALLTCRWWVVASLRTHPTKFVLQSPALFFGYASRRGLPRAAVGQQVGWVREATHRELC